MRTRDNLSIIIVLALVIFDAFLWHRILFKEERTDPALYFLDVGQGDSTLLALPSGIEILTDAGPNQRVVREVEYALGSSDRYIDLAILTHPQLDHFNGFSHLLDRYEFGAFIVNGRNDANAKKEWDALMDKIAEKKIPVITLQAKDKIRYGDAVIAFLHPSGDWLGSGELNDTSFVNMVEVPEFRALFTGDIGANVEEDLAAQYDLKADILKVGHHGSKYSSSEKFLNEVQPKLAVIEVGENRYGHPTKEALSRLEAAGAKIFRTDQNGTVRVVGEEKKLKIFVQSGFSPLK